MRSQGRSCDTRSKVKKNDQGVQATIWSDTPDEYRRNGTSTYINPLLAGLATDAGGTLIRSPKDLVTAKVEMFVSLYTSEALAECAELNGKKLIARNRLEGPYRTLCRG